MDRVTQKPYRQGEAVVRAQEPAFEGRFERRHRNLSDRVERFLMQVIILGLVGLVLLQTFLAIPFIRRNINLVEALEGIPWNEALAWQSDTDPPAAAWQPMGNQRAATVAGSVRAMDLTVILVSHRSAPGARLLIDGQPVGTFESGRVSAAVKPGQSVTVDGSAYGEELTFRVVEASGIASPALGTQVRTEGDQRRLGIIRSAE